MERVFGGILAILLFCAVLWTGVMRGLSTEATLIRALLCAAGAYAVGWLCFGPLGKSLIQGATRITVETPAEEAPVKPAAKQENQAGK